MMSHYSPNPFAATEMLIIRICHLANVPSPIELIKNIQAQPVVKNTSSQTKIGSFNELVNLFNQKKEMIIYHHLCEDVNLVDFAPLRLKIKQNSNVPHNLANQIANYLKEWLDESWIVTITADAGIATLAQQKKDQDEESKQKFMKNDLVKQVMGDFAGAKITKIKQVDKIEG